jgi:hypothetical protein
MYEDSSGSSGVDCDITPLLVPVVARPGSAILIFKQLGPPWTNTGRLVQTPVLLWGNRSDCAAVTPTSLFRTISFYLIDVLTYLFLWGFPGWDIEIYRNVQRFY